MILCFKKPALLVALLLLGSAAHADTAQSLLNKLPASITEYSQSMFSANTIGQVSLNGQYSKTSLNDLLARIRSDLIAAGYCEEPIRTVVSRGGDSQQPGLHPKEPPSMGWSPESMQCSAHRL